jgi:hypothetical protein
MLVYQRVIYTYDEHGVNVTQEAASLNHRTPSIKRPTHHQDAIVARPVSPN